jgi:hypothetical protein
MKLPVDGSNMAAEEQGRLLSRASPAPARTPRRGSTAVHARNRVVELLYCIATAEIPSV